MTGILSDWTIVEDSVQLTTFVSALPGFLDFASPAAANALFSLCAIALDGSYIIPIAL
jgi:hypothetical protein